MESTEIVFEVAEACGGDNDAGPLIQHLLPREKTGNDVKAHGARHGGRSSDDTRVQPELIRLHFVRHEIPLE